MSKQAVIDLKYHGWGSVMSEEGLGVSYEIAIRAEQLAEGQCGSDINMTIRVGEVVIRMDKEDMAELAGRLITALFLSLGIPNSAVPREVQGNIGAVSAWGQMEAAGILPVIVQKLIGETVIDGKVFTVRPNYMPNVESSKVVGLDGKAKQTWDGSLRPILMLQEMPSDIQYAPAGGNGMVGSAP